MDEGAEGGWEVTLDWTDFADATIAGLLLVILLWLLAKWLSR